ncbi:EAL domain-containing protein [Saxibacter everestensis]|uniref:EAL domain-containing protein n=1 Tax=Saxibacter everestensis TaxID=2909229 RepID=A0ABY8QWS0_9MICO|nr:EAL domain-containing protein [Brevibacteriaceae bacterium ZFBP1038]
MSLTEVDATDSDELKRIIRAGRLRTLFRPLVELESHRVLAYEALHTAEGSELRDADRIRAAIRDSDMVGDLDAASRFFALETAGTLSLLPKTRIFIDAEIESFATLEDRTNEADRSVVLQLESSTLKTHPAQVLRAINQARSLGWGIAMRGVGHDFASCAFLPLINPAVICLHPSLLRQGPSRHVAEVINLVTAHAERTGAVILADGISDSQGLSMARALGAQLGRGDYFAPSTATPTVPAAGLKDDVLRRHGSRNSSPHLSPYALAVGSLEPRRATKALLIEISKSIEQRALSLGSATILLAGFQEAEYITQETKERYRTLAEQLAMVVMVAGDLDEAPVPLTRGGPLDTSDPVRKEWTIVVIGPDWSTLLAAHDLGDSGPENERRFDFILTHDRLLAIDAARSLMSRIPAERN